MGPGVPGWALDMVHLLLWLWLLKDFITATGFRPCGAVSFDECTILSPLIYALPLWCEKILFLLLLDVWYLYQPDYCENGLNRLLGMNLK